MISRQSRDAWETRTTIPSESIHPDPTVQITSPVVIVPSMDDSSQTTILSSQSPPPENSMAQVTTGTNKSIQQENKNEHPTDIFDLNLFQNSQFPITDIFAESYFSYA
jgi:hypothetical protein